MDVDKEPATRTISVRAGANQLIEPYVCLRERETRDDIRETN